MYRVTLGAFDFGKDEASTPLDAAKLLSTLLASMSASDFGRLVYEIDDLENDIQTSIDLAGESINNG